MDARMQTFLEKVKVIANKTGQAAVRAADAAGKKAGEMANATSLNLKIFDLNTECEVLYRDIGQMVYDIHRGIEISNEDMDNIIAEVDEKQSKIAKLRQELASMKTITACSHCGRQCSRDDSFCGSCGNPL